MWQPTSIGASAEGLFRVSPSQEKLDALRAEFEKRAPLADLIAFIVWRARDLGAWCID
jgi:hypothetical protein